MALPPLPSYPAKRGYYGETWRMDTADGRYFLKLDNSPQHQNKYRNSLAVVDYLCACGIDFAGTVVKTKMDGLYAVFGAAVLAIFGWIDGENKESDETKRPEYEMLCKIYAVTKPGFDIPRAVFSDGMASEFYSHWEQLKTQAASGSAKKSAHCWSKRRTAAPLCHAVEAFRGTMREGSIPLYFTHGDAGGNLLAGRKGYAIPDWDEVMYAPPERDAWVMCCRPWAVSLLIRPCMKTEWRMNYSHSVLLFTVTTFFLLSC